MSTTHQDTMTQKQTVWTYIEEDDNIQLPPYRYRAKIVSKEVNIKPLLISSGSNMATWFHSFYPCSQFTRIPD